ncbi:MAG: type II toxin-antitoxin system VapC family toxin [Prevotellaceae bacterium]|jgi:PIN domain nuclease of toxin-antitoxin system|nr:type II toxin-antitoxin system VapC family toxin [Prevotellaceae bacterium]
MGRRYLLDTNIVLFSFSDRKDLMREVQNILDDYNNIFYVSATSVKEIIHLYNSGKLKRSRWKRTEDIVTDIKSANFELLPVKWEHLFTYAKLSTPKEHNDPNDHIIISQAIAERMILISSDRKFEQYGDQSLHFYFNDR